MTRPVKVAVLGAGVMGTGIATLAAGYGLPVTLLDVSAEVASQASGKVSSQRRLAQLTGNLPRDGVVGEVSTTTSMADIADATVVIEAVTELADLKAEVLRRAADAVPPGTLLVSNTSAVPIDEQANALARPEDLVGIHFMNPPYMIRTVEVIRGPRTSEAALAATMALLRALDRDGVVVGDGPGFVINRILQRMINEAARVVSEGIATAEEVDALLTGCLGHATGPLATADLIGLDNVADSLRVLTERTGDAGYQPCELLLTKVADGEWGRKTGRGFFSYAGNQPERPKA